MYSLIILSTPGDLLFFRFSITLLFISSEVIGSFNIGEVKSLVISLFILSLSSRVEASIHEAVMGCPCVAHIRHPPHPQGGSFQPLLAPNAMVSAMPSDGSRRWYGRTERELRIVSANVRGFHTNVVELTHRFIHVKKADIVFVRETFLDATVPPTYAQVKGYSA